MERHALSLGHRDQGGGLTLLHLIDPIVCVCVDGGGVYFSLIKETENDITNFLGGREVLHIMKAKLEIIEAAVCS